MVKKIFTLFLFSLTVIIVSGCGLTEEEIIEDISHSLETEFNRPAPETNMNFDDIDIYFPERFTVFEESNNNIIFTHEDQMYILFYNRLEPATSNAFYLEEKAKPYDMYIESYEDAGQFSYVKIAEIDESYELQVGTGGVRITTNVTLNHIEDTFKELVQMLNSIEFQDPTNE